MKNRFHLEEEISQLYNFVEYLNTISSAILEDNLDEGDAANGIVGISTLLKLQTNKLHDTMSQCFKLDKYKNCLETEDYL